MTDNFTLCPDCLAQYSALRFDPACDYCLSIMPLNSLVWPDEHPESWSRICCDECKASIMRLCHARTQLWLQNQMPERFQNFWGQAQEVIPNWPGFERLSLDEQQKKSLADCAEELSEFIGAVTKDFPTITVTARGDGLTQLTASRDPDTIAAKRPWWRRFWK